jgi:hypothetical protein
MSAVYGLYPNPDSAQRAVNLLRAAGVESRDIAVVSSEPHEEFDFGKRDAHTSMPWLAALGGLIGGLSGYALAVLTQRDYPLITGGMPLVAKWPSGIVTYELTMLGAILSTLATLLITARLPDWKPRLYDPAVSAGNILIGVVNPAPQLRVEVEKKLREAGSGEVKEFSNS